MKRLGALIAFLLTIALVVQFTGTAEASHGGIPFEQAKLIIEVNGTAGDAGLQFSLDSDDAWRSIEIRSPEGQKLVVMNNRGSMRDFGLTELFVESNEPPFDEMPLAEFEARFPAGDYPFSGITIDGERLVGVATLTHNIPVGPVIDTPADGVTVSPDNAVISWHPAPQPAGVQVVAYQVTVERQDPLRVFSADLSASTTSLTVSPEYLEPGTEYQIEVLAIDAGGNQTITESSFVTA